MEGGLRIKGTFSFKGSSDKPIISIITVTYNAGKLLEETIFSIQKQTYKNIEHIVIDAQSKDNTLDFIKKYENTIAYWKSEKDNGIYDGMNKGLAIATGDYVWFLNAGDLIESDDTLEKIISAANYEDVLYGETNIIDQQGKVLGTRTALTTRKLPERLSVSSLKKGMVVNHQSILVKRNVAINYDTRYIVTGDYDWVIRSLKNAKSVKNTGIVISRFLEGGFSTKKQKAGLIERFKVSVHHFGLISTLYHHMLIVWRNIFRD